MSIVQQARRAAVNAIGEVRRTLFGYDIFISYASEDYRVASALYEALKKQYRVFFDKKSPTVAAPLEKLLKAARHSRMVVVVLTTHASGSTWVADEVDAHFRSPGIPRAAAIFSQPDLIRNPPERLAILRSYGGLRLAPEDFATGTMPEMVPDGVRAAFHTIRQVVARWILAVVLTGALGTALALLTVRTPARAWMNTDVTARDMTDAVLSHDEQGNRVRALCGQYHVRGTDGGVTYQPAVELDLKGRMAGCIGMTIDEGGFALSQHACDGVGSLGSLETLWKSLKEHPAEFNPWDRIAGTEGQLISRSDLNFSLEEELKARAGTVLPTFGSGEVSPTVEVQRFYLRGRSLLALVRIQSEMETWTIPLLARDGMNWVTGGASRLDPTGSTKLTIASADGRELYLATTDQRVADETYGLPGAIFHSRDEGLTWSQLPLPAPWDGWSSFTSVVVASGVPGVMAVSLDPDSRFVRGRPAGVPGVILTRDGGSHWELLRAGLQIPANNRVDLVGVTDTGHVIALVRERAGRYNQGKLILWRSVSLVERLQGRFGTS